MVTEQVRVTVQRKHNNRPYPTTWHTMHSWIDSLAYKTIHDRPQSVATLIEDVDESAWACALGERGRYNTRILCT